MQYALGRHDAMNAALSAADMHHTGPTGLIHSQRIRMMHSCSPVELLTRAAFMHHDDQWHTALKHYAALTISSICEQTVRRRVRNLHLIRHGFAVSRVSPRNWYLHDLSRL